MRLSKARIEVFEHRESTIRLTDRYVVPLIEVANFQRLLVRRILIGQDDASALANDQR